MKMRYSWQVAPEFYTYDGFNLKDAKLHRKWYLVDNETNKIYRLPKSYIYDEQTGQYYPCAIVDKELNNYEFYLFMAMTCPDYYAYPKEFIDKEFLDIWVRKTSNPIIPTINLEWLNEEQKRILNSRFDLDKERKLSKHL